MALLFVHDQIDKLAIHDGIGVRRDVGTGHRAAPSGVVVFKDPGVAILILIFRSLFCVHRFSTLVSNGSSHEVRRALFRFIEGWYNTLRRHSVLNYDSPMQYERTHSLTVSSRALHRPLYRANSN